MIHLKPLLAFLCISIHPIAFASEKLSEDEILFRSCLLYPLPAEIKGEILTPLSPSERMNLRIVSKGTRAYIDKYLWPYNKYINGYKLGASWFDKVDLNSVAFTSKIFPYYEMTYSQLISRLPYNSLEVQINSTQKNLNEFKILRNITHLSIAFSHLNYTKIAVLSTLTNLKFLDLSYNNIANKGATIIAQLTTLRMLDMSDNNLNDAGIRQLSTLLNLKILNISNNNIKKGLNSLSILTGLTNLDISRNTIGTEIISLSTLTNLKRLNAEKCEIENEINIFSRNMILLEDLELNCNKFSTLNTEHLPNLTHLHIKLRCITGDNITISKKLIDLIPFHHTQ